MIDVISPAGSFINETGKTYCLSCFPGTAAPLAGQAFCSACSPGSFAQFRGAITCAPCPRGSLLTLLSTYVAVAKQSFLYSCQALLPHPLEPVSVHLALRQLTTERRVKRSVR